MHVAIIDDNGADRKQMERLLKRESDRRAQTTGVLYVDSFGSVDSLLANALTYDVFYVDVCQTPGVSVRDVIDGLAQKGSTAPVVLCSSKINYREQSYPENVFFLDKAIKASELSESISQALELKAKAPSVLELRDETGTIYVTDKEILYAMAKGRTIQVTLTNGRVKTVRTDLYNLYSQWSANHDCFLPPSGHFVLNCMHVQKLGKLSVTMADGKTFLLPRLYREYVAGYLAVSDQNN